MCSNGAMGPKTICTQKHGRLYIEYRLKRRCAIHSFGSMSSWRRASVSSHRVEGLASGKPTTSFQSLKAVGNADSRTTARSALAVITVRRLRSPVGGQKRARLHREPIRGNS